MNLYVFQIVFYDFANSADRSRHVKRPGLKQTQIVSALLLKADRSRHVKRPGLKQTQIVSALLLKNIDYYKAV